MCFFQKFNFLFITPLLPDQRWKSRAAYRVGYLNLTGPKPTLAIPVPFCTYSMQIHSTQTIYSQRETSAAH